MTRVTAAIRRLNVAAPALVILSPHGPHTGVYARGSASLRGFGLSEPRFNAPVNHVLAVELANAWGQRLLDDELDHGIVVPLTLTDARAMVVAATIAEDTDPSTAIEQGRAFARALGAIHAPVVFVASANTGAALSERAPLGHNAEAVDADRRLVEWLTTGEGDADSVLVDVAESGGSCGAGPLAAFGDLFPGRASVQAYESPFGVGYLVATAA
ncbi:MAG TPA: hypothetical protein VIG64_05245 [Actinomycetota bacterium]